MRPGTTASLPDHDTGPKGLASDGGPPTTARRVLGLVRAARPRQWIKNLACFAGLVFAQLLFKEEALLRALLAFAGFCLASSSVYLLNDVCDREADRAHPSKRDRPLASGLVPVSWALATSAALLVAALGSSWLLSTLCAAIMVAYLATNLAYSLRLKHTVLLDVGLIAFGFVLRVLYGVYAVGVKPTSWIVLCMFFLALFLGFAKRRGELHKMGEDEETFRRPVLAKYGKSFLDMQLVMTATMAILCYSLYTVTRYPGNASLVVTVPLVTYGVTRYMLLVMVDGRGESPEKLLVSDKFLVGTAALWLALCVAILYSKVNIFPG